MAAPQKAQTGKHCTNCQIHASSKHVCTNYCVLDAEDGIVVPRGGCSAADTGAALQSKHVLAKNLAAQQNRVLNKRQSQQALFN
jgi:hypothetical protein